MLGIEPGQLRWIDAPLAEALIAEISAVGMSGDAGRRVSALTYVAKSLIPDPRHRQALDLRARAPEAEEEGGAA